MTAAQPDHILTKADDYLAHRGWTALAIVMILVAGMRVWAYSEMQSGPARIWHLHSEMDTKFFSDVAFAIDEDPLLGSKPMHPNHYWHRLASREHFKMHPEDLSPAAAKKGAANLDPKELAAESVPLWDRWYAGKRYHQEPLFSYLTALFLSDVRGPFDLKMGPVPGLFAFQMIVGLLTIGLLFVLTRRHFGPLVAVVASLLAGFWGPMIHYEMVVMRTSLIIFFGVFLLWAVDRLRGTPEQVAGRPWWQFGLFGLALGLATALKMTFLVFGVGLLIGLLWSNRRAPRVVARAAVVAAAGVILVMLPFIYRNAQVGVPLLGMTSVGPVTAVGTNVPEFKPWDGWFPFEGTFPKTIAEVMHESSDSLLGSMLAAIGRHESVWAYCGLLLDKVSTIFHAFEMPNNSNYYLNGLYSNALSLSQYLVTFGWLLPFAVVGLWFARRRRGIGAWWWFFLCTIGPMIVFYSLSRFRAPLVIGLTPFAAMGLIEILRAVLVRRWLPVLFSSVVVIGLLVFMHRDIPRRTMIGQDYMNLWMLYYSEPMTEAVRANDRQKGVEILEEHIATFPDYAFEYGPTRPIDNEVDALMANTLQKRIRESAQLYESLGNPARLEHWVAQLRRLVPAINAYTKLKEDRARAKGDPGKGEPGKGEPAKREPGKNP